MKKSHKQVTQLYELSAEFEDQQVNVFLRTDKKMFGATFTNDNLPSEVQKQIGNIELVSELLKNQANYEVSPLSGQIKLMMELNINEKQYTKIANLKLDQIEMESWEAMYRELGELRKRMNEMQAKIQDGKKSYTAEIKAVQTENQELKKKMKKMKEIMSEYEKRVNDMEKQFEDEKKGKLHYESKIEFLEENFKIIMKNIMIKSQTDLYSLQKTTKNIPKPTIDIDRLAPYSNRFDIKGNIIIYKGQNKTTTQLLMKKVLSRLMIERFTFRIVNTHFNNILVGIVDRKKQRKARKSSSSTSAVSYFGYNGLIVYGNIEKGQSKEEGGGFHVGQTIEMEINLKQGTIVWKEKTVPKASIRLSMLKEEDREFVAYIQMRNKGDSVQWHEEDLI